MVRKQLYLEEAQDRALKKRARELGVSEAEIVRRALDDALLGKQHERRRSGQAIERFLDRAHRAARGHQLPADYRFDREALYAEDDRFRRWRDEK